MPSSNKCIGRRMIMQDERERQRERDAEDQAIAWQVRLKSGEASEEDREGHLNWLLENPLNLAAFEQAQHAWRVADSAAEVAIKRYAGEMTSSSAEQATAKPAPSAPTIRILGWRPSFGQFAVAASIVVALTVVVGTQLSTLLEPRHFTTAIGEIREVTLADSSRLSLDTQTTIDVRYSDDQRFVDLVEGRVMFDVRPDADRPFVVAAGSRQVRVTGTRFVVARIDQVESIALAEGQVVVRLISASVEDADPEEVKIAPGEKITFAPGATAPVLTKVDPARIGIWSTGQLDFENAPLASVVSQLNRYFPKATLRVGDKIVGEIVFSGSLRLADAETVARRLSSLLPVHYVARGDEIIFQPDEPSDRGSN